MEADERRRWTLLTSHGHVLVEVARNPQARVRDIAGIIGITERATQAIIADLERAGYVERVRKGRRTHYVLNTDNPFRHSAQEGLQVGPFLELLTSPPAGPEAAAAVPEEGLSAPMVPVPPLDPVPATPAAPMASAPITGTAPGAAPLEALSPIPEPPPEPAVG